MVGPSSRQFPVVLRLRVRLVVHLGRNATDKVVSIGFIFINLYQELGPQNLTVEPVAYRAGLPLLTQKGTAFAAELTGLKQPCGRP